MVAHLNTRIGLAEALIASLLLAPWAQAASTPRRGRVVGLKESKAVHREARRLIDDSAAQRVSFSKRIDREKKVSGWVKGPYQFTKKTVATVDAYVSDGNVRVVLEYDATSLGAWRKRTEHYFREDGGLAYLFVEMVAAYYEVRIEMRDYYDSKGELIQHSVAAYDLKTAGKIHNPEYVYDSPRIYLTVGDFAEQVYPLRILEGSTESDETSGS